VTGFTIRPAPDEELEAVARLHCYVREVSLPFLPRIRTLEEVLCSFPAVLRERDVLIAECDGEIVGYCAFRTGWIDHLYVHPAHQRRGIGSALLERVLDAMERCKLWVFQKNRDAIRFYERRGFRLVRTTDGENEEREPDALYERRLTPL
jgi:putative acetyltransferase